MEIYSYSIILISVFLCQEIQTQQCVKKKCESKNGRYKSCEINAVPDDNFITSVTVEDERDSDESNEVFCVFNVTYGYTSNTIWVNQGCRADFIACYSGVTISSTSVPSTTEKKNNSTEFSSYMNVTAISGITTKHINQSTSSKMKMDSNKSIAGLVAGIVTGVGFIALIILIFIFKRFSLSCFARKVPYENKNGAQDYTGNQNAAYIHSNASDIQGNNKNYTTLGNETDSHYYREFRNSPQSESEYNNIEPHAYMTVYDSFDQNKQSALTNATYEEVQQTEKDSTQILGKTENKHYDYAEFATNITNSQDDTNSKKSSEPHEYFILDPKETTYENQKCHSSGKELYSSQTKDYFVLDPKETGFDRSSNKKLDTS